MIKFHTRFFITSLLACLVMPFETHADDNNQQTVVDIIIENINKSQDLKTLENVLNSVDSTLKYDTNYKCAESTYDFTSEKNEIRSKLGAVPVTPTPEPEDAPEQPVETCETKYKDSAEALACCNTNGMNAWTGKTCTCPGNESWDESTYTCIDVLAQKQKAYDEAHEKEQSLANRTLTAVTTAATGIGGMELARGLAEQSADKAAEQDMAAYISTFRCTYGNGQQVKAGPEEIELPGGNDATLMSLRNEYFALAADLKERKSALGLTPGIESETILDKSEMGLYDDENIGIENGAYASIYRATVLGNETDQGKIDEDAAASQRRVTGGAIAAGAGALVGVVGDSLINGKLHEKIEEAKANKNNTKTAETALKELRKCLKDGGAKYTSLLSFKNFNPSMITTENINCTSKEWTDKVSGKDARSLFIDTDDNTRINNKLKASFGDDISNKLLGVTTGIIIQ